MADARYAWVESLLPVAVELAGLALPTTPAEVAAVAREEEHQAAERL